jgi:hypothetical protein
MAEDLWLLANLILSLNTYEPHNLYAILRLHKAEISPALERVLPCMLNLQLLAASGACAMLV